METQEVDPWRRRDAGQPPKEVHRAAHEVTSPAWSGPFHVVADAPVGQQPQSLFGDGAPPGVEAQSLQCCLLYTSPSPRDGLLSRMPSSA